MNDNWFGEHLFEIAVRRDALPAKLQQALDSPPIVLPAWDPMGALAAQGARTTTTVPGGVTTLATT